MKKIKGNSILGIGLIILSITLLLQNSIDVNEMLCSILYGVAIGLELLGLIKQFKENKNS